jgi:hypothetical protein
MKTAMQLLLKEVTEARDISVDVNFRSALDFVRDTIEWDYIEMEKHQILNTYIEASPKLGDILKEASERYYNITFNTNEK